MTFDPATTPAATKSGVFQDFTPKLVSVWREGYSPALFRRDVLAGITVAIVALPLSMAIAIASGASPQAGLFAAIVGGFLISALGGSRYQVGGPAGAFVVVIAAASEKFGFDGMLLATLMAGVILVVAGYCRLGSWIKYIPYPVIVGFTAGIATIIFASQLRDLFGLQISHDPSAFVDKLTALWNARGSFNPVALALSLGCITLILVLRNWRPKFPGFLAVVVLAALATFGLGLPVETIGTRFGGIPRGLPWPVLPDSSLARIAELLPTALTFALLGGIESLLSAVVADGMTGRRHRSNCELVAQGFGNIGSALFGGLCVTGTIARTATNVRAQAHGPVSGMLHAVFLLLFMLVAAPLASYIPLAALAAILVVVCWNMADKAEFASILRHDRGESCVLLATFLLTLFRDLTEGIAAGVVLGSMLFMHRMAQMVAVIADPAASDGETTAPASAAAGPDSDVLVFRIEGPFFFGAAGTIGQVFDRIGDMPRAFVIDLSRVPLADATAAQTLAIFVARAKKHRSAVYLAKANPSVHQVLVRNGLDTPDVTYTASIAAARRAAAGTGAR